MRIRITMELLGPSKKYTPKINPWAHDKKEDAQYVKASKAYLKTFKPIKD